MKEAKTMGRPVIIAPQRIISTALELLDQDGIDFSVRKLATQLDTGASTVYHHFGNRAGLLSAMAQSALEDVWAPCKNTENWEHSIEYWANTTRKRMLKNPARMPLLEFGMFSETSLNNVRQLAHCIEQSGLSFSDAVREAQGLIWLVIGSVFLHVSENSPALSAERKRVLNNPENQDIAPYLSFSSKQGYEALWQSKLESTVEGIRVKSQR